ncbi:LEAF RUST 10 DISEASE-RESISTANCE LOCUS RECEPTOR-LIKE PROTEIN KINASE-like 2.1 [Vigna radiata var. radiata]|uniref:LEAF RUST 10 DISEASE-RESISTANCE LOCUS RECEPTOR-LIKE PROTEIN KINASE-like 2.1 n=1 Tax=Vigna radiata var. radiata TaxID=3916 RepID=A0A1S3UBH0_VIGRR|nr:LEAF RUST 10 DISEASE-RESISTANCE LOCUS RECEPTOR-LIKE PROTEIN KINASE-like 2.1 [Vigna radiata var. radiata]
MRRERTLLVVLLLILLHHISATKDHQEHRCPPSSCGNIPNITYPFRLQGDPENCGDERYELGCENNVTVLYLYSAKYHVQAINYDNYTVRVVDPALQHHNCSSLPIRSLSRSNFSDTYTDSADLYQASLYLYLNWESLNFEHIVFLNCNHSVRENEKYVESGECVKWDSKGYAYAVGGDLKAEDLEVGCDVKLVAPTSFKTFNKHSYAAIHRALAYGFEIFWVNLACQNHCPNKEFCDFDSSSQKLLCYPLYEESLLQWLKILAGLPLEWLAELTRLQWSPALPGQSHGPLQDASLDADPVQALEPELAPLRCSSRIGKPPERYICSMIETLSSILIPSSYKQALQNECWKKAIESELLALEENQTWDIVPCPPYVKPLGSKFVFSIKLHSDGSINRYKA